MSRSSFFALACAGLAAAFLSLAGPSRAAEIILDTTAPGVKVSPDLWGIFFEEINRAGEGGIYAEKVLNRSFEDDDTASGWTLVTGPGALGSMRIDKTTPMNPRSPNALRLQAAPNSRARVGVANDGFRGIGNSTYKGMHFVAGETYLAAVYLRADAPMVFPVTVSLERPDGRVLARQQITTVNANWSRHDLRLVASKDASDGRLVISLAQPGVLYIDFVSLFPEKTWKQRPNGMRPDLMTFLDDLKPAFFRFPGGCWVEGDSMVDAYQWKDTIGDITARRNQHNLWRYEVTNGLGFHEYLQICEDLGAAPMYVANVGMAHSDATPMNRMHLKVQDALDAIEYANGPVDSMWGAVRARNGHPAPFNLKYLEIGNENGGARYEERYPLFYRAIKEKYPDIHLIADTQLNSAPVDILDEHYYNSPEFFIANAHRYDTYDRSGPRIYVGEYAVTSGGQGNGNLRAAIGEAAFMTGMERNSDVVIMASYAPLFAHVHYKVWNPDAIYFDNARSCATPSYYVQQMFSSHRIDTTIPLTINADTQAPVIKGRVGLGTWVTQAEFRDIRLVTGGQTLTPSVTDLSQWTRVAGDWQAADGVIRQTSAQQNAFLTFGPDDPGDFTFSFKARKTGGDEGFLIPFNFIGINQTALLNLGGWGNANSGVEFRGGLSLEPPRNPIRIDADRWYDIAIQVTDGGYRCSLDGQVVFEGKYMRAQPLHAVAGRAAAGEIVLRVVNVSSEPQATTLQIRGTSLRPTGRIFELTAASPTAENTLDSPRNVVPVAKPLDGVAPRFQYTFPPHSLSILRLTTAN